MNDPRAGCELVAAKPAEIRPGDLVRDWGVLRVVAYVLPHRRMLDMSRIYFEPMPGGWPEHLGVENHIDVCVWRARRGA